MKRYLTLFLLLLTGQLFAQEAGSPYYGFRLGLTAHPTLGWVKPEVGKTEGIALGFAYGLMADFNFADNYSFATGLTITTINGKSTELGYMDMTVNAKPVDHELRYRLQYIEVPLTLKLKTNKIGDLRWYGQFGLSNDFNIGAKQDVKRAGEKIADGKNISDYTRFYRAGLIVGGGAEYDLDNRTSLAIGLTFNNGFTNIAKNGDGKKVKNSYIGLNIGVFF
ncbi:Outer membrane protein beta-barrel domain-containing protein [Pedobacter steynii]|uniref:Outer membrane protein beta-barrel domain-containing protein n=1 Tax=Pedobacter steynii TaxID=430522 RepID=A0A1H0LNW1_9SPHI|nr:porin family protein [Pedobacter steynii]NQX43527.1 PorT family protein [Pedobacter steynii]SDO69733.1 Outer membrane protein beta-barrel domain-containing protein [Pedobacter steynii]